MPGHLGPQRPVDQHRLLPGVDLEAPGGGAGALLTGHAGQVHAEAVLDGALQEPPGPHVRRLLLDPHRLGARIGLELPAGGLGREGVELLDTNDGHGGLALVPGFLHVVEHLALGEDEAVGAPAGGAGSPTTSANEPPVNSSAFDRAVPSRSNDFGVITTSGLPCDRRAWRRRRWKYWAGVDGTTTCMLSSAASWRKRSSRALEWSGP